MGHTNLVVMRWVISSLSLMVLLGTTKTEVDTKAARKYLETFGYIEDIGERTVDEETPLEEALKNFQEFAGIDKTGVLDEETQKLMETPRCGIDDRVSDFVLQGSRWPRKQLTYRISKYPKSSSRLSRQDLEEETKKAFSMWQESSGLTFSQRTSGDVDIDIRFERYDHGDGNAFDGPGGVLAHAYFPQFGGRAHFDDTEDWSITPFKGNQILNTLTHEFGHSLGLRHSNVKGAIMAPFYKGWDPNLKVDLDDKKGIQALYGEPSPIRPTRRPDITTGAPRPRNDNNQDLCDNNIDAIVKTAEGASFV